MIVYGDILSGNCYKVKLVCALLDLPHQWVHVSILAKETRTDEFLAKNPAGQIPLLETDDGKFLAESNAILHFLAEGSSLLPKDRFQKAKVLEWQFFEQYSHEPYIAVARYIAKYLGLPQERQAEYDAKQSGGHKALQIMEQQLVCTPYLLGEQLTLADISLFAYTHVADEGGFDLSRYHAITEWVKRIKSEPKFIAMA
ncbi:MAG: glutathione S-transferase family protein [Gammaproteobacteria bacterium]|nr:glutathione S-transferase family protein [Gammaproteobacteria bacterium]